MLLAIDIGNTNIKVGVFQDDEWTHHWRVQTVRDRMPDEYGVILRSFFDQAGIHLRQIDRAMLSSVVPQLTYGMIGMIREQTGQEPLVLRHDLDLGITIATEQPRSVGSDLIANAVAGFDRFKSNCIVVNFGTATTLAAVTAAGELVGVSIAAGLEITVDSLVGRSAQLSHIPMVAPPSVIGRNTEEAMQSGLLLGHVAMVEGLLDRMQAELGGASAIATGGLTDVIIPLTDCFDAVDPWLTLEGLRLIAERN